MRFVQALHWLRDMLPSDDGSLRKRLVSILKDPDHGQAIQDDLRGGLSALPEWMRLIVRDLLLQANSAEQSAAGKRRTTKRSVPRKPAPVRPGTSHIMKAGRQRASQ
jgi:hypothetical protein